LQVVALADDIEDHAAAFGTWLDAALCSISHVNCGVRTAPGGALRQPGARCIPLNQFAISRTQGMKGHFGHYRS